MDNVIFLDNLKRVPWNVIGNINQCTTSESRSALLPLIYIPDTVEEDIEVDLFIHEL